jgi:hypothetical protein
MVGEREENPSSQVVTTALARASIVSGTQLLVMVRYSRKPIGLPQVMKGNTRFN